MITKTTKNQQLDEIISEAKISLDEINSKLLEINDLKKSYEEHIVGIRDISDKTITVYEELIVSREHSKTQLIEDSKEITSIKSQLSKTLADQKAKISDIYEICDLAKNNYEKLEKLSQFANSDLTKIKEFLRLLELGNKEKNDEYQSILKLITKLYTDITDKSQSHQFARLKNEHRLWIFGYLGIVSVCSTGLWILAWNRLLDYFHYIPFGIIVGFFVLRLTHSISMFNKYSFKEAIVDSLRHNVKILQEEYKGHKDFEEKIFYLLHDSLDKAYERPYHHETIKWFLELFVGVKNGVKVGVQSDNKEHTKVDIESE